MLRLPTRTDTSSADNARPAPPSSGLAAGWALLLEAGTAIAGLADVQDEAEIIAPRDFAMLAASGGPERLLRTEQMIDDCAATLHCGLNALADALGDGRDVASAALALWREFDRARRALVGLVAPLN